MEMRRRDRRVAPQIGDNHARHQPNKRVRSGVEKLHTNNHAHVLLRAGAYETANFSPVCAFVFVQCVKGIKRATFNWFRCGGGGGATNINNIRMCFARVRLELDFLHLKRDYVATHFAWRGN